MFRSLEPATFSRASLETLAKAMSADVEFGPDADAEDAEENQGILAGYTYLGQFIDHDLTFDPVSSLQRDNDPASIVDTAHRDSIWTACTGAVRPTIRISTGMTESKCGWDDG